MKAWSALLIAGLALGAGAAGGYWIGHRSASEPKEAESAESSKEENKPTATVTVVALHRGSLSATVTVYGTVVAPANDVRVVSVPFESRVTKILAAAGQTVAAGQPLIEIEASAAAALALEEVRSATATADHDLQSVKERYDQKLATNAELSAAQSAQRLAKGRLANLEQSGAARAHALKAENAGVVSKVDVQVGQIVPIGGPLIETVAQDKIAIKLGVEPADAQRLIIGQSAQVRSADDPSDEAMTGKIAMIGQRVDPTTRLVDVLLSTQANPRFRLESYVVAEIAENPAEGWIVPRQAILPADAGGYQLFTIADGKAVAHAVKVGMETDRAAQVIAEDLKEGDSIVIEGNYELENGMKVHIHEAPAPSSEPQPATTEPATASVRDGRSP